MARQSLFGSAKLFVETSVGLTVDTVTLVRNELQHTSRLNGLENDIEFDDTVLSAMQSVLDELAKIPTAEPQSKADEFKAKVLTKRLAKLQALV